MTKLPEILIKNLTDLLHKSASNQSDLARKSGIHRSHISSYLAGKKVPSLETLEILARSLGVSPAHLLASPDERVLLNAKQNNKELIKNQIDRLEGPALEIVKNSIDAVLEAMADQQSKVLKKKSS